MNCERFNVHIRNKVSDSSNSRSAIGSLLNLHQLIEAAAGERFNQCTAMVLRATLKATEPKQRKLSDVRSGGSPSCAQLQGSLNLSLQIQHLLLT